MKIVITLACASLAVPSLALAELDPATTDAGALGYAWSTEPTFATKNALVVYGNDQGANKDSTQVANADQLFTQGQAFYLKLDTSVSTEPPQGAEVFINKALYAVTVPPHSASGAWWQNDFDCSGTTKHIWLKRGVWNNVGPQAQFVWLIDSGHCLLDPSSTKLVLGDNTLEFTWVGNITPAAGSYLKTHDEEAPSAPAPEEAKPAEPAPDAPPAAPPAESSRCDVVGARGFGAMMLVLPLALVRRRRR